MDKQEKVLKLIKQESGKTTPLGTIPNDECYTSMQDILNELSQWSHKFENKNIICPCDWDIVDDEDDIYSLRIDFDDKGFHGHTNTVKSISCLYFTNPENPESKVIPKEKVDEFLNKRIKCNFIRTFVEHAKEWKIKSITASGFNPATGKGIRFQEVDFTQYDICVTNPPFSLYNEFLQTLLDSKIDFIVLAPFLNRANPCVGLPLMLRQCYLGYGRKIRMNFYNPTATNKFKTKLVAVDWITTFDDAQKEINKLPLTNGFKYENYKDDFVIMKNMTMKDGTHPIRVESFRGIPDDYYGWVFCAIGVLDVLSYDYYEWYITNAKGYYNRIKPSSNPFIHRASNEMVSNPDTKGFHGVVLRRIK